MTFADIKTAVIANVIDLPPTVLAAVPKLVNDAIRNAERRYNFKYMERNVTLLTGLGSVALGVASGVSFPVPLFKEYRDRGPYVFQQFALSRRLAVNESNGNFNEEMVINAVYPDRPRWVLLSLDASNNATFVVQPYADANSDWGDGNYRIIIPYYAYSALLVGDTDTNWLVNNADDYIIYKATAEAFNKDWDYNSAALWLQQAEQKFQEVKTTDKKQKLSGFDTLVPHWEGADQGMVLK